MKEQSKCSSSETTSSSCTNKPKQRGICRLLRCDGQEKSIEKESACGKVQESACGKVQEKECSSTTSSSTREPTCDKKERKICKLFHCNETNNLEKEGSCRKESKCSSSSSSSSSSTCQSAKPSCGENKKESRKNEPYMLDLWKCF